MMPSLQKDLPVPLYYQLKNILLHGIESGEWKPDEQLPTESDIAARFGVSKITVRQALRELADMGRIRREQGRGTFVSPPKLQQGPPELTSFSEEMHRRGLGASSRVLEQEVIEATAVVASALQLKKGDSVFRLKRLRLARSAPMGIQTAHLPAAMVPRLVKQQLKNVSLYEILRTQYDLVPASAHETHSAVLVNKKEARLLQVPPRSPALAAERITFLADGRPLEFVTSIMRGDRYRIVLDLIASAATRHPLFMRSVTGAGK
jgi:GntR family transcriptional regulator